jgi:hypothetical protein
MNSDKTNFHDILLPDDKLHLVYYLDHAYTKEKPEAIKKKPFVLWCCGKILNENDSVPYLFIVCSGRLYRSEPAFHYEVVVKNCIIDKIELHQVSKLNLNKIFKNNN